jgi:hypothetical protein
LVLKYISFYASSADYSRHPFTEPRKDLTFGGRFVLIYAGKDIKFA